jgi:hypothetical protein
LAVVREDKSGMLFVKAPDGYIQGLPRWMTDASICATVRSSPFPYCSAQALLDLVELIRIATGGEATG